MNNPSVDGLISRYRQLINVYLVLYVLSILLGIAGTLIYLAYMPGYDNGYYNISDMAPLTKWLWVSGSSFFVFPALDIFWFIIGLSKFAGIKKTLKTDFADAMYQFQDGFVITVAWFIERLITSFYAWPDYGITIFMKLSNVFTILFLALTILGFYIYYGIIGKINKLSEGKLIKKNIQPMWLILLFGFLLFVMAVLAFVEFLILLIGASGNPFT